MSTSASTTIYAFLDDTALHRRTIGMGSLADKDQGVGYLDDQMVNYFMAPSTITDRRSLRLRPIGIESIQGSATSTNLIGRPDGKLSIHFDGTKIGNAQLSAETLTEAELNYLFNIIEYAAYSQNENGVLPTAATMNAYLNGDHAAFGENVYVTGSLNVSAAVVDQDQDVRVRVTLTADNYANYTNKTFIEDGTSSGIVLTAELRSEYIGKTGYVITQQRIEMYFNGLNNPLNPVFRTWIEFKVNLSNDQVICFHIFLSRESFMADYPYSNITDIIYPCEPSLLRELETVDNVADLLSDSSHYINTNIQDPVRMQDHSGVYIFKCEYINNVIGNGQGSYNLYFGVMYKGHVPPDDDARIAIKEDLLKKTGTQDEDWMDILPDLFASATFMLIPLWHHVIDNGNGLEIPSQVYGVSVFKDIVRSVYPNYTEANIDNYLEILPNRVSGISILAIPSTDNAAQYRRIRDIHPTYMALPNGDADVGKQASVTIDFAEKLNNTLGTLMAASGTTLPDAAKQYNGSYSLSFTCDGITYYVLTRQSYPRNIVEM